MTSGDHYILRKFISFSEEELFRRDLVEISVQPWNISEVVQIHVKSNEFFIFVSNILRIYNISFIGYDLEIQNFNNLTACYNNEDMNCCFDEDYKQPFDLLNNCSMKNRKTMQTFKNNNYGMFNLENIFDNNQLLFPIVNFLIFY